MVKNRIKPIYIDSLTALFFLLFLLCLSMMPVPKGNLLNDVFLNSFDRFSYKFQNDVISDRYLIIECPRIPRSKSYDSYQHLINLLRELIRLDPQIIIFDTDPGVSKGSQLFSWMMSDELQNRLVVISPDKERTGALKNQTCPDFSLTNASFAINQKQNLEVINFTGQNNLLSPGNKVLEMIYSDKNIRFSDEKIKFYFKASSFHKINHQEFLDKKLRDKALKDKIVFVRTGLFSFFDRSFLTSVGIVKLEVMLLNDIETKIRKGRDVYVSLLVQKGILLGLFLIILLVFMRFWVLKAVFISLIIFELAFVSAFGIYAFQGYVFNYANFAVFTFLFIISLILLAILKMHKSEEALLELDQLKKNIAMQNKALISMKKLIDLGKLSSGIYHEISNPLHNILNSMKMIAMDQSLSSENKDMLAISINEIKRLQKLSKNLKGFYKPYSSKNQEIDINEMIKFSLQLLKSTFSTKKIQVILELTNQSVKCIADGDQLQQVFLNLFLNAVDAIHDGGSICISSSFENQEIVIHIEDSGPGIAKNCREQIFEAFFTTKKESGSGMGLFVVHEIIQSIGGKIKLGEYCSGKGAEFDIQLPAVQPLNSV